MTRPSPGYQNFWPSDLDLEGWPTFIKKLSFWIRGVTYCCYRIYVWLPPASYVVFLTTLVGLVAKQFRPMEWCCMSVGPSVCLSDFNILVHLCVNFLYARLQTGRIMVLWCPSVRVSVRLFSALFSLMLWHIELKFCTWLSLTLLQIKFECHHFVSIFEGVMLLCELRI